MNTPGYIASSSPSDICSKMLHDGKHICSVCITALHASMSWCVHGGCGAKSWSAACAQAKYTAKANDKISEARGKQPQPALNEEMSVNRYNAMKAAAAAAINRWVLCLSAAAVNSSP